MFGESEEFTADSKTYGQLKGFWSVGNSEQFSVEQFEATGGIPALNFESDWDRHFSEDDGDEVVIRGKLQNFNTSFVDSVSFSDVPILCSGDGCVDLKAANPDGVQIEFRSAAAAMVPFPHPPQIVVLLLPTVPRGARVASGGRRARAQR